MTAFQTRIDLNEYGDHDPCGIVYALDDHVEEIKDGDRLANPLLLRANEGDCIELTLTNGMPECPSGHDDHPRTRTPEGDLPPEWEPSNRISLHSTSWPTPPTVPTARPLGSTTTRRSPLANRLPIAGTPMTTRSLRSPSGTWGGLRSNRHHGAFGQLIVEPEGSEWFDSQTSEPTATSPEAIIKDPNGEDFREFSLAMSDTRYIINDDGAASCHETPMMTSRIPMRGVTSLALLKIKGTWRSITVPSRSIADSKRTTIVRNASTTRRSRNASIQRQRGQSGDGSHD